MAKLSEKQKRFADYYIEFGNASEAARKAGYSPKFINGNVPKLLRNTAIREYLDARLKQIEDERIASAAEVMKYLTAVMRGEETEEVVVVESLGGDNGSEARRMDKAVGAKDRLKAAELLGKRYALFTEKLEAEVSLPVVIKDDITE